MNNNISNVNGAQEYVFERGKGFGRIYYAFINSFVNINQSIMQIKQERELLIFFKKNLIDATINVNEINDIVVKKTIDPSDMIFAITFGILGIYQPLLFILSAILIWTGFGKKVVIYVNNNKYEIPTNGEKNLNDMIENIKKLNPAVSLKL